jgi:hypothetical protein
MATVWSDCLRPLVQACLLLLSCSQWQVGLRIADLRRIPY